MAKSKTRIKETPDKAIKRIEELAKQMRSDDSVVVGLPEGSNNYPDGTSVIMVGAAHEFGSPEQGIPQRSFLRSTVVEKRRDYEIAFRKLAFKLVQGSIDGKAAMRKLGLILQKDVRQKITDLDEPALQYREGNPLVDTGHLRRSINFEVNE